MLQFKAITFDDIEEISPYLEKHHFRTCDLTQGGIFLWINYFNYEYAIEQETLFIKGLSSHDRTQTSFAYPLGALSLPKAIDLIKEYCKAEKMPLILSALPKEAKEEITALYTLEAKIMENWSDYLYDIEQLATYNGKKYSKKRNHVNKFIQLYPNNQYDSITHIHIDEVRDFFDSIIDLQEQKSDIFHYEREVVSQVLQHYERFNFICAALKVDGKMVGFTIGEIVGDTMMVHIEKSLRSHQGVSETLCHYFAHCGTTYYPNLRFSNREEDAGDEGLRKSKLSYHPIDLEHKYYIEIPFD